MLDYQDFVVVKTIDDVAFDGEIDGDVTNELQDLTYDYVSNTLRLTNSLSEIDLSTLVQQTYWSRDVTGKLYPSTISDKIGIGINSPETRA